VSAPEGETLTPASEAEAAEMIRAARAARVRLDIVGGDSRAGLGRPRAGARRISTRALDGLVFYAPEEMTLCARAGTPLAAIEAAIAERGQMLPFEPARSQALYATNGEPTLGGLVAANVSGPRRVSSGAARDSVLGVRFVNGFGEAIKSGGRVMKNVTGLDLTKLTCGAHGTLGLVTEATIKLAPKPETEASVVVRRLDDSGAILAMTRALGSPYGVSGAAMLQPGMGREFSRVFLRLEGFADSVAYRTERLIALLADLGAKGALRGEDSARLWRAARDATFLAEPRERAIWRVSLAASQGPPFVARLGPLALAHFYDWGGGLVWVATDPSEAAATALRAALAPGGGHATLFRAPEPLRARVPVFQPLSETALKYTRGIKASFDPDGVLNYGRMVEGV